MTDALLPPVATGIARRRRGLILPVTLLLLWEGSSQLGLIDPKLLPSLGAVAVRAWTELVDGRLIGDITASLTRDLAGFAIGGISPASPSAAPPVCRSALPSACREPSIVSSARHSMP
jgi:ABC-type nitrate/sulfonate/bicarbonate transport system permease component